ncbi:MAG: hypothetical protein KDC50_08125 [Flavobacterium sp.]|nr:hypothetical protein [Flavobacterium sp.]
MKKISFLFVLFLIFNKVNAQVDRSVGRTPNYHTEKPKGAKKDPVELTLAYLKEELSLDSFQEAAVKVYLMENQKSAEKIHASDISNNEKKIKFEDAVKDFHENILKILNPEQIIIFEELKNKNNNKSKKKKKN